MTLELVDARSLPHTEIWLSEDGTTWWIVETLDVSSTEPTLERDIHLGYSARFIRLVMPDLDTTTSAEIGGIRGISLWPTLGGTAPDLNTPGAPVTPVPNASNSTVIPAPAQGIPSSSQSPGPSPTEAPTGEEESPMIVPSDP